MADLIKKIKIKKQDGTFTGYIPIGADAKNIATNDGDSVELKLNKKPYYYNSVANMKADIKLKAGDMAITLGYYEPNDGGGATYKITSIESQTEYQEELENELYADLIIENNEVNVRQFGAYGDKIHDDTQAIQNALNYGKIIKLLAGNYVVSDTLKMKFNTSLIGTNSTNTYLYVTSDLDDKFIIEYGSSYNYGSLHGKIKNINFRPIDNNARYSRGIILNSGCIIDSCYFYYLKQCITKVGKYTDSIKINRCSFMYCENNDNRYIIDLYSNSDAVYINQIRVATSYSENTFNEYMGLRLTEIGGGSLNNSILNCPIYLNNCKAFSINNCHIEGASDNTPNNLSYIRINNSEVKLENIYMHKTSNGANIRIIGSSINDTHASNSVEIENLRISYTTNFIDYFQDVSNIYDIEKDKLTILKLKNCFVNFDFSSSWQTTNNIVGIRIKDLPEFNKHSSYYSLNSLITLNNNIITDIPKFKDSELYVDANLMIYSTNNNHIPWYESGYNDTPQYYQAVIVLDEDRKLALLKSGSSTSFNVTSGNMSDTEKRGGLLRNIKAYCTDSLGATLFIYRGDSSGNYKKLTKVSSCSAPMLFDFGTSINGFPTIDREVGGIDTFTYVKNFKTIGENVEFSNSSYPTIGIFKKGDRCINSDISSGNIKSWIYDGATWVSEGIY